MLSWIPRQVEVRDVPRIIQVLSDWEPAGGCGGGLQAGDVGWMLRYGVEQTAANLIEFSDTSSQTGAIFCNEGGGDWWFAIHPDLLRNRDLAGAIAEWAEHVQEAGMISFDGPHPPATWRQALAVRGFEATADTWAHLWKPLGPADIVDISGVEATVTERSIADRVAVQQCAFDRSTFTVDKWHAMAENPVFRPEFDLLARDTHGAPVAAVTAWFNGVGKCARIEPMGTHREHRRQGHGKRVLQAAFAALAREGAASVCVVTPGSNTAAVELYHAAGFRLIGSLQAMVRERGTPPE